MIDVKSLITTCPNCGLEIPMPDFVTLVEYSNGFQYWTCPQCEHDYSDTPSGGSESWRVYSRRGNKDDSEE